MKPDISKTFFLAMMFFSCFPAVVTCSEAGPGVRTSVAAPEFPRVDADLSSSEAELSKARTEFALVPADPHKKDWVKAKLAHMLKTDQGLRGRFYVPFNEKYTPEENRYYMKKFDAQLQKLDRENAADLKKLLKLYGWFRISEWGKESDLAAWLIVQHSDTDLPFQKKVLKTLKALYPTRETDPANYAMLYDRVAVHENLPQRYGTQGGCEGPGLWKPDPVEGAPRLDERRRSVGLGTEEAYIKENGNGCN